MSNKNLNSYKQKILRDIFGQPHIQEHEATESR